MRDRIPPTFSLRHFMPWVFIVGVLAGVAMPTGALREWWRAAWTKTTGAMPSPHDEAVPDPNTDWARQPGSAGHHATQVVRVIDGDTFEARVQVWPGLEAHTRIRLRGIDAPEMKASCAQEERMAHAARDALVRLLDEGQVTVFNVGPDKYAGRVVADVGTASTQNVSKALFAAGHARIYERGRRQSWCE